MSNETKKYAGLKALQKFLDNCKTLFASISHKHKLEDITDYKVDTALSSTSTNPLQNKVINEEFDAVSEAMGALEAAIDDKADKTHNHDASDIKADLPLNNTSGETVEGILIDLDDALTNKANVNHNHDSKYDAKGSASGALAEAKEYTDTVASGKANSSHTHSISNVTNLQSSLDEKVPTSRTVNGKELSENITLSASDVGAAASSHTHDAYVNQNAFSNVKVGSTTVVADAVTDTLEIASGTGISISGDATNDKITITNSGVRSISTGTSNGTISVNTNGTSANVTVKGLGSAAYTASTAYDAAGTAQTKADTALASAKSYTDTAISNLINSAPTTLDTLGEIATAMEENADVVSALETAIGTKADANHVHAIADIPNLQTTLDGKAASSHTHKVANISDLTATATELNYMDGVTSNVQTQLDGKAASSHSHTITASASDDDVVVLTGTNGTNKVTYSASHANSGVTAGTYKSVTVNAKGHVTGGSNPTTLSGYGITDAYTKTQIDSTVSGLNTAISGKAASSHGHAISDITNLQSSLDGKAASGHTHNYAGSSSAGGAATSANKVNSSLTVKLNGGTTEGTNMFTFNGSAAKAINITPSAIGAQAAGSYASSSHTHDDRYYTETEIDSKLSGKANSSHGNHVPATQTANNAVFLRNDNTWATVTPANIGAATSSHSHSAASTSAAGFMSASDKSKLDGIAAGANAYSLPTASSSTLGGVKTGSNITNSSGTISLTKDNVTAALGYTPPTTNTTYSAATQSAAGLMSADDKTQIDYGGIPIVTTAGSGSAYTATIDGITSLKVGTKITIIPHVVSAENAPTLNVNSLGAKAIRMPVSYSSSTTVNGVTTTWLAKDRPVTLEYNGTYWLTIGLTCPSANYLSGTVPVANGGTGATDAATARTNLGALGADEAAVKVAGTLTNPSSATFYAIPFHSGASTADKTLLNNNGLQYQTREGSTSQNGYSVLTLGNSTANGAAGNKYGEIHMYSKTAYRGKIQQPDVSADVTHKLPTTSGTLLNNEDFTVSNGVLTLNFL